MFVDKLPDAANLAIGGFVFGQFVTSADFSLRLALAGIGVWAALMVWAAVLAKQEE